MAKFYDIPFNVANSLCYCDSKDEVFTKKEWDQNNDLRYKDAEDQQKQAERIIGECERIKEETQERTVTNKEATEHRIVERIEDIEFVTNELQVQRVETCKELEALAIYKIRLMDCITFIKEYCLKPCKECILLRKNRIGIDLVIDEAEVALHEEMCTLLQWLEDLETLVADTEEAMRRIRAAQYAVDLDLEHKEYTALIDRGGANLKHHNLALVTSKIKDLYHLNDAKVTKAEWDRFSAKNIANAMHEVAAGREMRVTIDAALQRLVEDLEDHFQRTNRAIKLRILETKKAKAKLEDLLAETIRKEEAMKDMIVSLEKALEDKKPYVALVNSRQENRNLRPGAELVKDAVAKSLTDESAWLKYSTEQIQNALNEAQTSLRYLMQTHAQLEEEINIKIHTLKIDEVEVMTIRDSMRIQAF